MGMKTEPASATAMAEALKNAGLADDLSAYRESRQAKAGNSGVPREVDAKGLVRVFSFKVRPTSAETARQQVEFSQMDVFLLDHKVRSKPMLEIQEAIANRIGTAHWYRKHVAYLVLSPGMSFTVNF